MNLYLKSIPSFEIDHTRLKKGLYLSQSLKITRTTRLDTFDIRVCEPYVDEQMGPEVAHAIEHIGATYLRNTFSKNDIVYFGPMGCLTGFYLILRYKYNYPLEPIDIITQLFLQVIHITEIPGATKIQCGNYEMMDLNGAKAYAAMYLNALSKQRINLSCDAKYRYTY